MSDHETIRLEGEGAIRTLALDRPDHLNGITNRMMRELHEALTRIAADDAVRVLILTGSGRGFCPGADLHHYAEGRPDDPLLDVYFEVPRLLHEMPAVTIAAINGACAGAGLGFALACDLRWAAEGAKFNTAFLDVGAAGDMAVPWFAARIVGATRARELCLLPGKFTAARALELGLLNGVHPADALASEVRAVAERLAGAPPLALRGIKANFVDAERMGLAEYLRIETLRHRASTASEDSRAAFRRFGSS